MAKGYTLIKEFTTPILETGNKEKNRFEGFITQGRPYPDFTDDKGDERWYNKLSYDPHKIYLALYWVDEENSITQEHQVMELTGLNDISETNFFWPVILGGIKK
tara:strand:+ start:138 stop:449 length:312 start_codon:yes stop_codon:yes gene_type:complete